MSFLGFFVALGKIILGLIFLWAIVYIYGMRPIARWRLRKLPGPPVEWIVGNIFQARAIGNHEWYRQQAKIYGPIYKTWGITGAEVIITSPKLVKQVLTNNINRSDFVNLNGRDDAYNRAQILAVKNDKARAVRAAWAPFFYSESLSHLADMMNKKSVDLTDRLSAAAKEGGLINFSKLTIELTLDVISTAAFGVDIMGQALTDKGDSPEAKRAIEMRQDTSFILTSFGATQSWWFASYVICPELGSFWHRLAARFPDPEMKKTRDAEKRLVDTILQLVVEHKQALKERGIIEQGKGIKPKGTALEFAKMNGHSSSAPKMGVQDGSFLDCLIRNRDRTTEKPFEDLEIVAFATAMLIAGFETTASTLAFAIYNLAKTPEKARALEAEVDALKGEPTYEKLESLPYCDAVMRETLRMYPSASIGNREASCDQIIGGYKIPKGTGLRTAFYAMQRDENLWERPDDFIPERWISGTPENEKRPKDAWAAFGDGPRQCMGYKFVMEEGIVALVHIFRKFRFKLGPGQDPLPLRQVMTLFPAKGVWVTVHNR